METEEVSAAGGAEDMLCLTEISQWIDEVYLNELSIYHSLTFRQILETLLDRENTIYKTVAYKRMRYHYLYHRVMFSFDDRTTYLIALIEQIDDSRIKKIFEIFLEQAENINFFHPSMAENTFNFLFPRLREVKHNDLLDKLLLRKEIACVPIMSALTQVIRQERHIWRYLEIVKDIVDFNHIVYVNLLYNYIGCLRNTNLSAKLVTTLVQHISLSFEHTIEMFVPEVVFRPDLIQFLPLIDWRRFHGFRLEDLRYYIQSIFKDYQYYDHSCHSMIAIYCSIVREYKLEIYMPESIVQKIVLYNHDRPEHYILMDVMGLFEKYKCLLPPDLAIVRYLTKQYHIKTSPYALFWRHKTYMPGSKIFNELAAKYKEIMQTSADDKLYPVTIPKITEYFHMMELNPYLVK